MESDRIPVLAKINPKLFAAIKSKTGLSDQQVYKRIALVAMNDFLPRPLAAIKLGADVGVTINRFATADELYQLRKAGTPVTPPHGIATGAPIARARTKGTQAVKKPPNQVFVVHGRDRAARDAMFTFLRAIGVKPIEWNSALAMSKKAAPYIGEVLMAAFNNARAVVVLLTPDDFAQLRPELITQNDKAYERTLTGQARPNVLFEAGMAFATHPGQTVMVQLGTVREFSDVAGRHIVHMSNEYGKRQELSTKLKKLPKNFSDRALTLA